MRQLARTVKPLAPGECSRDDRSGRLNKESRIFEDQMLLLITAVVFISVLGDISYSDIDQRRHIGYG
jgi:hypothetical protein